MVETFQGPPNPRVHHTRLCAKQECFLYRRLVKFRMPYQDNLDRFNSIKFPEAPLGTKSVEFDDNSEKLYLLDKGFAKVKIGAI